MHLTGIYATYRSGEKYVSSVIITMRKRLFLILISALFTISPVPSSSSVAGGNSLKHQAAKIQIESLESALKIMKKDLGRYPNQDEGLELLVNPFENTNWKGPYLTKNAIPMDPWGNPYQYYYPPRFGMKEFDIYSFGLNNEDDKGQEDDISNWKKTELYTYYGSSKSETVIKWICSIVICLTISLFVFLFRKPSIECIARRFTKLAIYSFISTLLLSVSSIYSSSLLIDIIMMSIPIGWLLFSGIGLSMNIIVNIRTGFSRGILFNYFIIAIPLLIIVFMVFT